VADLLPGDKAMAARVERLIETVKADRVAAEVVEPVPQEAALTTEACQCTHDPIHCHPRSEGRGAPR
jgi:hypothetical protein